jgi:hypothetical protein
MSADRHLGRLQARIARLAALLAALALLGLCVVAPARAQASFIRAWGWGVLDGQSQFESCMTSCQRGFRGGGAGQFDGAFGVAVDGSGDVFVIDYSNNRVDEFSPVGVFIKAWGWGVADGASRLETCATTCQAGILGGGAGQLGDPKGVAVDGPGDVFVADGNGRIDEFSPAGAFIKAWGWGVADGKGQLETCTITCRTGLAGSGAGELVNPEGVAVDGSGDVIVADASNQRVDEFSSSGAFIKAWGWGVADGASQLETCTITCKIGLEGGGAGQLAEPQGVAVDGLGDVFVADRGTNRVDEFSSSGAFIKAWGWGVADGKGQLETCRTTCQAGGSGGGRGQLYFPAAVAVDGSGDVFVADTGNARVDEFSSAGAFIQAWGWGVADGKGQLETCITTCEGGVAGSGAGQLLDLEGVAVDGSGEVFVTDSNPLTIDPGHFDNERVSEFGAASSTSPSGGGSGPPGGGSSPVVPVNTARPVISGTPRAGRRLSCSTGSWRNNPPSFAYQWYRNGTLLAGFTTSTYTLGALDEGTTITCVVTATNAAGSASAQSKPVKVPVPVVPHCPAATGAMSGTTIGLARLGMTRARARYLYRRHSDRGKQYEDFFCLTPIGVRVGYASPLLLKALPAAERSTVTGRVVWASTSNPYYSLDGIRPGESITTAAAVLDTKPPFHIGLNYWYLARKPGYTAVLKVRGTVVQELGIATNALTKTRHAQSVLMHSFY